MEVQASSETVLAQAQSFFQQESTHGGEISRPMEYTIQVEDSRSGFPQSAAGWIFNLTLTVLTLGSWLLVDRLDTVESGRDEEPRNDHRLPL